MAAVAGRLDRRLRLDKRQDISDEYGNTVADWHEQFSCAAGVKFLRGGESVIAARLTAKGPAIVTLRNSAQARGVTAGWRAVDARSGVEYAVREAPRESDNRGYLEFMVEAGVAA
jgi:SPP1 family predicted phage head-tail adaptor